MPRKTSTAKIKKMLKLRKDGWTYQAIADELGVSHKTVVTYCAAHNVTKKQPHRLPPPPPPVGADDEPLDLVAVVLGEIDSWRKVKQQCVAAGDGPGAARASSNLVKLIPAGLRAQQMAKGESARPMPPDEELRAIADKTKGRLFSYIEKAAAGK